MKDLKVGDVVRLKCGGPMMVVHRILPPPNYCPDGVPWCDCYYFNTAEQVQTAVFSLKVLVLTETKSESNKPPPNPAPPRRK